jgi:hypothetical protein
MHRIYSELRLSRPMQRETPAIHSGQNQLHHERLCRLVYANSIGKEQADYQYYYI